MKYLQAMPTNEVVSGLDLMSITIISLVLIAVILVFDRYKVVSNRATRRKL